jgi:LPXTG-motif cell wall-anchored protein
MNSTNRRIKIGLMLTVAVIWSILAVSVSAQVQTETNTTSGQAAHEVTVERGEVVLVRGNDLIVKMQDGSIRHFPNVSESARATVDGRQLGIHDLKPGMKLERTITVISTPKTVTTVQTVTGKVWHIVPPNSVILTLEDGTNQQFRIPKDQKFKVDGRETDAWGLKKGMKVSATKIVEVPEVHVQREERVAGTMPPAPTPPPAPPADEPILIAQAAPVPVPGAAPAELPKTGSILPLIGLLGCLSLLSSAGLGIARKVL